MDQANSNLQLTPPSSAAIGFLINITAPTITVHINRLDATSSNDLVFLTTALTGQDGPYLFDLQGNLLWDGHSLFEEESPITHPDPSFLPQVHKFHVVEYQGIPHPACCTKRFDSRGLNSGGSNVIMNSSYAIVEEFDKPDVFTESDPHEFELVDNGSAFIRTGRIRRPSISPLSQNGVVGESIFQDVDVSSRNVDFEWRSLNHVAESETCLGAPQLDYYHLNSVEKDFQGNYIINGFHFCGITKINGTDGSIIWRLGGNKSDFKMLDDYTLMHMHHVRIRDFADFRIPTELRRNVSRETHLALSIFDNGYFIHGGKVPTAKSSSALVVLLDLEAMTGQVIERYTQPQSRYGVLFGSVQFLANGDRFIGWGGQRGFSQYTQNNELVFHADLAAQATPTWSYRTFRAPWSAQPTTLPDLYTYSWTCHWNTSMYASWNGATDVASWRFSGRPSEHGPFAEMALVAKDGFETRAMAAAFVHHVYVEALRADGLVLGRSRTVKTEVPIRDLAPRCSELRCGEAFDWTNSQSCSEFSSAVSGGASGQSVLMSQTQLFFGERFRKFYAVNRTYVSNKPQPTSPFEGPKAETNSIQATSHSPEKSP